MFAKINFHDEFYQKLKLLVLPITMQQFMLALVSATDAIMLGGGQPDLSVSGVSGRADPVCLKSVYQRYLRRLRNHGSAVLGEKGRGFH